MKQKCSLACLGLLLLSFLFTACVHLGNRAYCYESGIRSIDVAPDDSSLVFSYCNDEGSYIATSGITGNEVTIIKKPADGVIYNRAIFSNDGGKIFFIERPSRGKSYVYSIDTDGSNLQRITSDKPGTENIQDIAFSRDGDRIYYINSAVFRSYSPVGTSRPHDMDFYFMNSDGSGIHKITNLNSYGLGGLAVSGNERFLYHRSGITNIQNGKSFKMNHFQVSPSAGFEEDDLIWGGEHPLSKVSKQRRMILSCKKINRPRGEVDTEVLGYGLYLNDLVSRRITSEIIWLPSYLDCPTILNNEDVVLFIRNDARYGGENGPELWRVKFDGSDLERIDLTLPR